MEETRLQEDQRSLSRIFPDVVWLLIYGQLVRRPEQVESMFFASAFFRHLLYSRRNEFLFARLLSEKLIKLLYSDTKFHETETLVFSSNPHLLKFRQICRSWKETAEIIMLTFFEIASIGQRPIIISLENEDNGEAKFMSYFEESHSKSSHHKSPFIGNVVHFYIDWNNDGGNAVNWDMPLKQVLPKYGGHIRKCHLDFDCKAMSKQWFEAVVIQALLHIPNAKALKLNLNLKDFVNAANLPDVSTFAKHQTETLKLTMNKNTDGIVRKMLSKMSNLRTLGITYKGEVPSTQNLLPTFNSSQLENLELSFKAGGRHFEPSHEHLLNHPTLQEHSCFLDAGLHASFKTLEANSPMNYLRTLEVSVNCTLPSSWHEWKKYTINVRNLADFTLSTWTWPCIDMVLLFRDSLKKLTLHVQSAQTFDEWKNLEGAKKIMEREEIKFLSRNASFRKNSNIWKKISKLTEVVMSIRVTENPTLSRMQRFYPSGKTSGFNFEEV